MLGVKRAHHDLRVWKESIELVVQIYLITAKFPKDETYGLMSQMRRAAIAISSNIAEGAARSSKKEFLYFLSVARGSLSELETQMIIAKELGYINGEESVNDKINEVFGLLGGLIKSLKYGKGAR